MANSRDSDIGFHSLTEKGITTEQNMSSLSAVVGAEDRSVQAPVWQQGISRVGGRVEKPSGLKAQNRSRQVRIQLPDEDSCSISGACHLVNGSLVIADSRNRRLKLVDPTSGEITNFCLIDEEPTYICCTGPQEIAVVVGPSFYFTQFHVYCAVCLTRTQTPGFGHDTSRIACHGGLLYCTSGAFGDITLYVYGLRDGTEQKIRLTDINIPCITGIAVNGSGNRLYVTDYNEGLVCFKMNGQRIFHLTLEELRLSGAQGVTTDHHGHVFVCGQGSNNVVKVTEDGHVVGEILSFTDGILRPCCLSYDVSRRQLCVGVESGEILIVEFK